MIFDVNHTEAAELLENKIDVTDSCGRRTNCYFYKITNGNVSCRALTDFYNVENINNQCGNCPFFKTETEFKSKWDGGLDYDEDEFEEAV